VSQTIDRTSSIKLIDRLSSNRSKLIDEGQRFLGFSLGDRLNALIPLVDLQATIKISLAEILPVPQMKDSLLGIINYRGKATWVLDLAHLMGAQHFHLQKAVGVASASAESSMGMGMLFQIENETVALLIDRVNTIETYDPTQLLPISDGMFSDRMRSFLSGYFMDARQQPWVVVDLQQVTRSII
jgi:positive phototaxis protein PixI